MGQILRCSVALGALALASVARADEADPEAARAAQSEFEQGKIEIRDGRWPEGCRLFEQSFARWPAVSTELKIARCHEHDGRLVAALSLYEDALRRNALTASAERREELARWTEDALRALRPRIAWLRVGVRAGAPGAVRLDGVPLEPEDVDRPRMVDPGEHELLVATDGKPPERFVVGLPEGALREIDLEIPAEPPAPPAPPPVAEPAPANPGRWAAPVLVGAGVATLLGGSWLAVRGAASRRESAPYCGADGACLPEGRSLRDTADLDERLGIGLVAAGAVGVGIGAWLWAAPASDGVKRDIGVLLSPRSVAISGSWW